ncbi:MAG: hypothetical protein AAF598_17135, partial [Bacteroidota bacterium]
VNHAEGDDSPIIDGASCDIRGCNLEGIGEIEEQLTAFDPSNYFLSYTVTNGMPKLIRTAQNSWQLKALGTKKTQVYMKEEMETNGWLTKLMSPLMKMQFGKMLKNTVEEFKHYVETGKPHPRKIKAAKKFAAPSNRIANQILLLVGCLFIGATLNSCKISDLRTDQISETSQAREPEALQLLEEVIANNNLQKLARSETYALTATDHWKGIMKMANPLPKNNTLMELRYQPNSFDGQFQYTETKNQTVHGVQSLNYYQLKADGTIQSKKSKKIAFTLPALQYFFELPLRLLNAPILKYAGTREFEGVSYDLIFATWQKAEPHKEHDQYLLYIAQGDRQLKFANYTVRSNYLPAPKSMFGSIRYEGIITSSEGITYPSEMYIQVNELKKKKKSAHVFTIKDFTLNKGDLSSLYPLDNIDFLGDSKN